VLAQFDPAVLEAVARASKRSSAVAHEEMKGELYSLATTASVAPLVGLFGTVVGIAHSFGGCYGQRSTCIGPVAGALSESMLPTALGLAAALVALWSYEYLAGRLRTIDLEMENASLELLNQLSRFRGRFAADPALVPPGEGLMFGARPLAELSREDKALRQSMILTGTMLALAWCALAASYVGHDALPLETAVWSACFYIPILFGTSCLLAYPLWIKLLNRRPGGLAGMGSAICLAWALAEFLFGRALP
jgi:hypothetical protein